MDFHVLGPLRVIEEGRMPRLGGPKQQLVLALLLARANQTITIDRLIDGLWGDAPPATARHTLQTYVSTLRKEVGVAIETTGSGYSLRVPPDHIDALRFEKLAAEGRARLSADPNEAYRILRESLSLWSGHPYGDFGAEAALVPEAVRLEELRLGAIEDRLEAELALGYHAAAAAELEALTVDHPLRERLWSHFMLALYQSGRQADALRAYGRLRTGLVEELGIDPSPMLQQLEQRILEQDASLDVSPGAVDSERQLMVEPVRGYEVREEIGSGDFGSVYRGYQSSVGREVAIKVIRPEYTGRSASIFRFELEAQAVAQLEHPHIVGLIDYWRDPAGAFLVMRYLSGGSLRRALKRGPWRVSQALRLVDQIGSALAYAHRNGVVHGDLQPGNVLLDEEGNGYLTDFATAVRLTDGAGIPVTSASAYLSPEARSGKPLTVQSDVFSLGVLIRALLTGTVDRDVGDSAAVTKLDGAVLGVIKRATSEAPRSRYERVDDLLRALRQSVGADVAGAPDFDFGAVDHAAPLRNPYKGLRAFQESDAVDFFGREGLIDDLLEAVERHRVVGVVGPSGSGKSSAVRAGLVPALRARPDGWLVAEMFPGSRPFEELEAALMRVAVQRPANLIDELLADERGLLRVCKQILPPDGSLFLLFIDQFEELFSPAVDEITRQRLLDSLVALADDERARVRVIVTLRADYYDRPLGYPEFGALFGSGVVSVSSPDDEGLAQAISRPARQVGLDVEPGLAGEIIGDTRGQAGGLPLMQYALTELFASHDGERLTIDSYRASGGVLGSLGRRAEELYAPLPETAQDAARQLFLRLVTVDEDADFTRRRVRRSELDQLEVEYGALDRVITQYGSYRLLSFDRDPVSRSPTVEVAHEALLREWPRLARWIAERRDDLILHHRLAAAAQEWERAGRDPSYLLGGTRLELFEEWATTSQVAPTREDLEYVEASRVQRESQREANSVQLDRERELEQKSQRRLRAMVTVLAMAAVVATTFGVYAFNQQETARRETAVAEQEARLAKSRELAAAALSNIAVDPDLAIQLALAAVEITQGPDGIVVREAEEALHLALQANRTLFRLPGWGIASDTANRYLAVNDLTGVNIYEPARGTALIRRLETGETIALALGPSAETLAIVTGDGSAEIWETESSNLLVNLDSTGVVDSLEYAPNGDLIAGTTRDGQAIVWNVETGAALSSTQASGAVGVAFNPDGTVLAVPHDGRTVLVDPRSGQKLGELAGDGRDVAFSPDGTLLATTGLDGVASIWDLVSRERLHSMEGHLGHVQPVSFNRDGSRLATGGHDGTARVWDTSTGEQLLVLPGQQAPVNQVAFAAGDTQLVGAGIGGTLVWDIARSGSREVRTIEAHDGPIFNVTYSPDGSRLGTAGLDGVARIWNVATGDLEVELTGHTGPVTDVVFSPDGARLATASFDGTARIWSSSGTELFILEGHTAPVWGASFSPDGSRLATVSEDTSGRLWDVTTGSPIGELVGHQDAVYDVAWSPDEPLVVTVGNDFTARLWDPSTSTEVGRLTGHQDNIVELAFSPDGSRLATAGFDAARVWDVKTKQEVLTLTGHGGVVLDVEASPDSTRWATGGTDATARLWDAITGRELLVIGGADGNVARLAFSPDGARLATVGDEGLVRIYALEIGELVKIAKDRASRTMTDTECLQYLHEDCP